MASSPFTEASQSNATVVYINGGGNTIATQTDLTVIYNFPAEIMESSAVDMGYVGIPGSAPAQTSQVGLTVVMKGRTDDPSVKAWTFTLDGHDFYVLRLGTTETLVYDVQADTWYNWASDNSNLWNVYNGINWTSGNGFSKKYGSNILVGSDSSGALFFLDPLKAVDDSAVEGRDSRPFLRRLTSSLPLRGYDRASVFEVQVIGTTGELLDNSLTDMTLFYSDDRGDNYVSAGTISIPEDDYSARASWRSLGSFSSPGRLFRLEDNGALQRVDSFTINSNLG